MVNKDTLTEGIIWKQMLLFAFPIFLGNIFQQLYNTFDSWVVGKYLGDQALAAVSSSASLIFLLVGFFSGVAMGAGILIARYFGAKDHNALEKVIHTNIAMGLTSGVILTILGVTFTPTILGWMDTPKDVLPQSISYFRFYFCGAIFTVMYNTFVGILHAVGDSRHPLYYLIASSILNVFLDLLFVGHFKFGVGAAAIATTLSQGLSATLCFVRLVRCKEPYRLNIRKIAFHKESLFKIIRYGLPAGIQNSVIAIANVFVQSNINGFGSKAMAGCGAYSKLEGFAFLPVTCFTQALATFVGQNLGAKKYNRVKKGIVFGIVCCVVCAQIIGITFYTFAPQLIGFFNVTGDALNFGVKHMRTICLFFSLLSLSHCMASILRGAGKPIIPMLVMLGFWCALRVTYITIALRYVHELTTVSWAYPLTWACSSVVFTIYLLSTDWIHSFEKDK